MPPALLSQEPGGTSSRLSRPERHRDPRSSLLTLAPSPRPRGRGCGAHPAAPTAPRRIASPPPSARKLQRRSSPCDSCLKRRCRAGSGGSRHCADGYTARAGDGRGSAPTATTSGPTGWRCSARSCSASAVGGGVGIFFEQPVIGAIAGAIFGIVSRPLARAATAAGLGLSSRLAGHRAGLLDWLACAAAGRARAGRPGGGRGARRPALRRRGRRPRPRLRRHLDARARPPLGGDRSRRTVRGRRARAGPSGEALAAYALGFETMAVLARHGHPPSTGAACTRPRPTGGAGAAAAWRAGSGAPDSRPGPRPRLGAHPQRRSARLLRRRRQVARRRRRRPRRAGRRATRGRGRRARSSARSSPASAGAGESSRWRRKRCSSRTPRPAPRSSRTGSRPTPAACRPTRRSRRR